MFTKTLFLAVAAFAVFLTAGASEAQARGCDSRPFCKPVHRCGGCGAAVYHGYGYSCESRHYGRHYHKKQCGCRSRYEKRRSYYGHSRPAVFPRFGFNIRIGKGKRGGCR